MLIETNYHNCNVNTALTKDLIHQIAKGLSEEEKPNIVLIRCPQGRRAEEDIAQFNGDEIRGIEVLLTYAEESSSLPNKITIYKRRQTEVSYNAADYIIKINGAKHAVERAKGLIEKMLGL